MKSLLITSILLLFLSIPTLCMAMPPTDKVAHFGAGYIISDQLTRHTNLTFIEKTLVVGTIAYIKEKHDAYVDRNDILATVVGGLVYEIKF